MRNLLVKLFGDPNEASIKPFQGVVAKVNAEEAAMQARSDEELASLAGQFRTRLDVGETLDDLLPESFASTREVARRRLGQRHYDVQLIGGAVLHAGKIAEMRTGEGKTLTATLAVALNAAGGRGVHLVTVNDYLAKRDAQWMGQVYHGLGLSVGVIQHESAFLFDPEWVGEDERLEKLRPVGRKEAYLADITYGTNNEFGFDYLRDNMVPDAARMVQRDLVYAIVDEVDNILIDEARTPLIISGQAEQATDRYYQFAQVVRQLKTDKDYEVDIKHRSATLTEEGIDKVEQLIQIPEGESIYDERYIDLTHYLEQALKAQATFHRDKDYIVRDGEVIIVDEFTGRMMMGRRYSEGLHQAIEAKEGVRVRRQNVTLATITFQNYFRMYEKLAGMTGTAKTEAEELRRIYELDVVVIPTNKPIVREDMADLVYKNERGKFAAVVGEIEEMREKGRPVLVGTASIEASERLSKLLQARKIPHEVLNAKQHEREAAIVAQAGQAGNVTIATNMAGRGTDIVLGEGVREAGGLHIVGTERHEARRIDNQLRGRAGRQGDPGSSRFYVSLEDELMRRFGSERIVGLMEKLGMEEDVPIEHGVISKSIENAQVKVEGHNFDLRKHVVQYDDVMNRHREAIYADRRRVVDGEDMHERVWQMIEEQIELMVDGHLGDGRETESDWEGLLESYTGLVPTTKLGLDDLEELPRDELVEVLIEDAGKGYDVVEARFGPELMRKVERHVLLTIIDKLWVQHLTAMDELREGVGLQAYGQKDPLVVYKTEGYKLFDQLRANISHDVAHTVYRAQPVVAQKPVRTAVTDENGNVPVAPAENGAAAQPRKARKIGPNDQCPCGSGKKFKHCHGAVGSAAGPGLKTLV
ncbi:MAG: Protein translocase subunit SecA [uncultured Thermomicrobiales bacterium]|uniref:Protein translocase subunit SecA n=1 Tax=uncultured Thermomicrobiales bacterium TaxID=1645740 RepID=A0A6J4V3U2_9BACT|nr:MAG: Protein translocase subunit SecA [uncultured Thermomicrobiales bacterium]